MFFFLRKFQTILDFFLQTALLHFKRLSSSIENNSLFKTQTAYEQPWDTLQTSVINNRHGGSLQKIPNTELTNQHYSSPTFPLISSSYQHSEDTTSIPIDRYL
jgi:hypothetical protein